MDGGGGGAETESSVDNILCALWHTVTAGFWCLGLGDMMTTELGGTLPLPCVCIVCVYVTLCVPVCVTCVYVSQCVCVYVTMAHVI